MSCFRHSHSPAAMLPPTNPFSLAHGAYVGSRWYQVAVTGTKVQVTAFASDDKESQAMHADCARFGLT
jgi:hypothetical protein